MTSSPAAVVCLLALAFAAQSAPRADVPRKGKGRPLTGDAAYQSEIKPLLSKYCFGCHGEKQKGDLDLRVYTDAASVLRDRKTFAKQDLTVSVPGGPTGMVFVHDQNEDSDDFMVQENGNSGPSAFLFATEGGTILGWNPNVDLNNAIVAVDQSGQGSVFKGIDVAQDRELLFAADFVNNRVDVFDDQFHPVTSFTDPDLPKRFAPFNVAVLHGAIYVAFAKRERGGIDNLNGAGLGYVDVFSADGRLKTHLIANGPLNAPWGMTIAPDNFGSFSNALLVGNFGDGRINAFDPYTGDFLGTLNRPNGHPLNIDGLWALDGNRDGTVTFSAGPNDESNGLVGKISVAGAAIATK